jgi:hypothetical protein
VQRTLDKLAGATTTLFWPAFLLVAVALVAWSIWRQPSWRTKGGLIPKDWGFVATLAAGLPLVFFVIQGAAFAYHDDDMLLEYSVVGRNFPVAIWPGQGRYFPLFVQEFNLVSHISTSPFAYYGFIAAQLVVLCLLLNMVLSELAVGWRVVATVLAIYASGTAILFVEAIYPERNIVFLLAIFVVALRRFDKQPSRLNMAVALLSAHAAMYYKEPVFLFFAAVALIRLATAVRRDDRGWKAATWRRPLELGLLAAGIVYAGQLAALLLGSGHSQYVDEATIGPLATATRYIRMEPLLVAFLAAIVVRFFRWRRTHRFEMVWDAVGAGAIVYFLALVAAGLAAARYMGPVELIGALFVAREAALLWAARRDARRWLAVGAGIAAATTVVAAATVSSGAFRVVEHASVVSGTEKLADFVASYAATQQRPVRLYFPAAEEFRIMNFASYLNYQHGSTTTNVEFAGPHAFPEGLCVGWTRYTCQSMPAPQPGDLVVHLPDDAVRTDQRDGRTRLFEYSWLPTDVPRPIGDLFYVEAPLYTSNAKMPQQWLTASVELEPV